MILSPLSQNNGFLKGNRKGRMRFCQPLYRSSGEQSLKFLDLKIDRKGGEVMTRKLNNQRLRKLGNR